MLTTTAINKLLPQEKNYDVKDTPYLSITAPLSPA